MEAELGCEIAVDVLDMLPTPFGLVRFGVAPDHPEVKAVQADFEQVASDPRLHFFGNVRLGQDVSAAQLSSLYDVVVLAYGAAGDRALRVPGADLKGVFSARAFVNWYNGHPDFAHLSGEFHAALASSDTVVVVGVGNVALDCARILVKGADALRSTDICEHTMDVLESTGSKLRRVLVLGRRGHVQASFTIKELRELTKLDGVTCVVKYDELEMGRTPASLDILKATRAKTRIDALLTKVAEGSKIVSAGTKSVELRFLLGPLEVIPSNGSSDRVGSIRVVRNRLELNPGTGSERAVAVSEETEVVPCGMVLGSIGYLCLPVEGVPYDDLNSVIKNEGGRVAGTVGMYCSGWARRGPSGIIGTNITDARSVVAAIVQDMSEGRLVPNDNAEGRQGLIRMLASEQTSEGASRTEGGMDSIPKPVRIVNWDGYKGIDRHELASGGSKGKPREKLVDIGQMLEIADKENKGS